MRIELPQPSWSDAQRAQDDAHTLTLPVPHPRALPEPLAAGLAPLLTATVATRVLPGTPSILTLTF